MSTDIRVALVYEQDEGAHTLRVALANAGVTIAVECRASALDAAAVLGSRVDAIVVNLDSELEDLLDEVTDALDSAIQPVIFNDPAASSDLSGWDRARWMRHLAAKMKGKVDVTPPAPPGSFGIPSPPPKAKVAPIAAAMPAPEVQIAPIAEQIEAAPKAVETPELSLADLDLMFETQTEEPVAQAPKSMFTMGEDIGDLDELFGASPSHESMTPSSKPEAEFAELDLDSLFDAPVAQQPATFEQSRDPMEFDLDAIFSAGPDAAETNEATQIASTPSELTDLDALFREFADSQSKANNTTDRTSVDTTAPIEPEVAAPSKMFSLDWSLEPIEDLNSKKPEPDKPVVEWRLDAPSKPISKPVPESQSAQATTKVTSPAIPAALEESLAISDLKLLEDDFTLDSANEPLGELEALDLSSIDLQAPATTPAGPQVPESNDELALLDLDFVLDLEPTPETRVASPAAESDFSSDFNELDALFEPLSERSSPSVDLADLNRVFVLGASIGGPEAIKAFLSRLPANTQAAFVVAQHMGAEFLAMMATQLDHATALSVRCPKPGERLRHGEVIVAPANEQLDVDASGHIRFSASSSGSPYNPSIDHLARSFADRFGDHATLILFSGMGSDAVEGGRHLTSRGGQVWVQDRASCVIASMIDSAKSQGLVRFEGTPAELAERVLQVVS